MYQYNMLSPHTTPYRVACVAAPIANPEISEVWAVEIILLHVVFQIWFCVGQEILF